MDENEIIDVYEPNPEAVSKAELEEAATVAWLRMEADLAACGYPEPVLGLMREACRHAFCKGATWQAKRCLSMFRAAK